jgi:hypothetical protein
MSKIPYRVAVGSLIYLATHAVLQVAQIFESTGRLHWNAILHIFRYLKNTTHYALEFDANSHTLRSNFGHGVTYYPPGAMFADSEWANDLDKRKSVGGYLFMMHGGVIDYNCKKFTNTHFLPQKRNGMPHVKQPNLQLKWLRNLVSELRYPMDGPVVIFEDNKGCVSYGKRSLNQSSMKHIDLKFRFSREEIANKTIYLKRASTICITVLHKINR